MGKTGAVGRRVWEKDGWREDGKKITRRRWR